MTTNPLLAAREFPLFDEISPRHIQPAIETLLKQNQAAIAKLLPAANPSWRSLIAPLYEIEDTLSHAWSIVNHLKSVCHSDELTQVYTACLPHVSDYFTELSQNTLLYKAYEQIFESAEFAEFTSAQKKAIEYGLRDFKLAGVHLPEKEKKHYANIVKKLSELQTQFEDHLIKAIDAWFYHTENAQELTGIPEHTLNRAKHLASEKNLAGWVFPLDFPTYYSVISYADNRQLREKFYTAYITRASDQGPNGGQFDNTHIMNEILQLRHELAKLLGFANYAELSLATKMAKNPDEVFDFLWNLVEKCQLQAKQELNELIAFAKETGGIEDFAVWDMAYFSEKLKTKYFSFDEEMLRAYFPENIVLTGLFTLASRLFGIHIQEESILNAWHSDVRLFSVHSEKNIIGYFYLDLYARPNKRSGAWMDECQIRREKLNRQIQKPIAYLICNFNQPTPQAPSLLSHHEVITLFHEFGHGLQHLLTTVNVASVSGIQGIPWDAVELPSQFMEHWCWNFETLELISSHHQTQEKLPHALFEKITAGRNFQSGMQLLKQLEYSLFDFHLHRFYGGENPQFIQDTIDQLRQKLSLLKVPAFNRFQHSFSHIFGGSYAAGYYSYLWAEVLACDAFLKFEQHGYVNPEIGHQFRDTILALGGSKDAEEIFYEFRGRKPSMEALLKYRGIDVATHR